MLVGLLAGEEIWFDWAERGDRDEPEPYCPPYLAYLRPHHPSPDMVLDLHPKGATEE